MIDAFVTTVYRNTIIQRVASIPGYVAKKAKDRNLLADKTFVEPIVAIHGGPTSWDPSRLRMVAALEPMYLGS